MEAIDSSAVIDLLPGYTETKLKLASIAEILQVLARERKDEERTHSIQRLLADLAEDAFRLAVIGKYNRGKSSLMNAMLGHYWLPTGILPLTSVITTVRYGTKQRVLIRTEGSSLAHEISLRDLPQYVTEEFNPGNRKRVDVAEVQLPSDLLRYGFLFIDTPGLGSGITANTEATQRFLPEVDAAVVVLSFESPLDQGDIDLLLTLHRMRRKLFIVLNKADLVSPDERDRITSFVRDRLAEQLQEVPLLFPLSVRDGLSARTALNDALLEQSALRKFEDQLVHFLTTQKSDLFLRRLVERTRDLLEQEQLESFLSEQLNLDRQKADALNAIKERERDLLMKVNATFTRFEQQLPGLFYNLLDDDLRLWCGERKDEILSAATADHEFHSDGLSERLRAPVRAVTQQLRESEKTELNALLEGFSDLQRRGNELLGRENPDATDAAGLLEFIPTRDIEVPNLHPFEWNAPEWSLAIPSNWLRKRIATRLEKELSLAFDSHCAAVRAPLEQACRQWFERGQQEAVRRIQSYGGRLEALRNRSHTVETTSILQDLNRRLDEIVQSANGLASAHDVGYSGTGVNRSEELCSVCRKASDAAFHFLGRLQYQLTKDPGESGAR